eukprot:352800-Chlamydomonas_euryale.AAC.14
MACTLRKNCLTKLPDDRMLPHQHHGPRIQDNRRKSAASVRVWAYLTVPQPCVRHARMPRTQTQAGSSPKHPQSATLQN